ncbi:MAG TPA: hypothetical protein EYG09_04125 [Dehalococcoidia bacterium]|nr:hypothetical protein [Dehalococcoidia bacterium]
MNPQIKKASGNPLPTNRSNESHNIVIIGAGSAGLATSYFLTQQHIDHVVLERGDVGNTWDVERWDGFYLVNPNWAVRLPGFHYVGTEPEGYLSKTETIDYLKNYAKHFGAPVRTGVDIDSLEREADGYFLTTRSGDVIRAPCVVVATGAFGVPKTPDYSADLASSVTQIHSAEYRNPQSLGGGAGCWVGSVGGADRRGASQRWKEGVAVGRERRSSPTSISRA